MGRELYGNVSPQSEGDLLLQFILQYYDPQRRPPQKIYLSDSSISSSWRSISAPRMGAG